MLGHDKYGRGQQSAFQRARSAAYKREQKGERGLKRLNKLRAFGLCTSAHA